MPVEAIFIASGLLIIYPYIGYPAVLWTLARMRCGKAGAVSAPPEPRVTLIISAHNEEKVIEDKILNSLALDYPAEKIEITVVSDGSDDGTDGIVKRFEGRGVVLRRYEGRLGKTACLNRAVPLAAGEIIVFSDANSRYDRDALRHLVKRFSDPRVGFVTGGTRYAADGPDAVADSVGFYSKMEKMTKSLESSVGSCVGADGAIFAVRKGLFRPLKAADINDLVIPLNIIKQGFKGKYEPNAFCVEQTAGTKGEFNRQVRITARTLRAISGNTALFNPFRFPLFAFELFSHKVLRLAAPFFLMAFLVSNGALISRGHLYAAVFAAQASFYLVALLEHLGDGFGPAKRLFSVSYTFSTVNAAILWGWVKFLKGEAYVTWSPTKR